MQETGWGWAGLYVVREPLHGDGYGEYAWDRVLLVSSMLSVRDVDQGFSWDDGGQSPDTAPYPCSSFLLSAGTHGQGPAE